MADGTYVVIDTTKIDKGIGMKDSLIKQYDDINTTYDDIVSKLDQNWKGHGAEAFMKDANTVKQNIKGIYDILKTMCDTLTECKLVLEECDNGLGEFNRDPQK
ncbi:hypothetical protein [Ruminococcus albus]|uniref:Uncharacterized conserved protein YukE n=1 Tax=Ruminococcus albus TaxID=1264 RepID=A0A1I1I4B9_RUMAL|nr:hypothetical protein [Ruminococcus albus]SFC28533.1 Uncharacterized conserved protein YukE [Ruminococcus albus]